MASLSLLYVGTLPPRRTGASIVAGQILGVLGRRGHRVRALAPIVPAMLPAADTFTRAHREIELAHYPVPHFEVFQDVPSPLEYRQLEGEAIRAWLGRELRRDPPDVVIAGSETYAFHVPDFARASDVPCVLMVHGGPSTGILAGTYPPARAAELLGQYRKMDRLITMGHHWAARLGTLGLPPISVIPNPVDLDRFRPRPKDPQQRRALGLEPSAVVVLHASHLGAVKRPLDLVWSAERALAADPRLVYVIAGDGALRDAMEAACRERGLRERFRFVGWVEHDRMPALMSLADVVALPSEHETQALVYLETQACGGVLLASDIPAAREVIVAGRTGLLFERGNIDELTRLTLEAAASPEMRASIGRAARARVAAHALPVIVDRYVETLEEVANASRSGRATRR